MSLFSSNELLNLIFKMKIVICSEICKEFENFSSQALIHEGAFFYEKYITNLNVPYQFHKTSIFNLEK